MATTDLRFLSAGFREEYGDDHRYTGKTDMVLRCATEKGVARAVVISEDDALRLIEQVSRTITTRREIDRARAEREAQQ